MDTVARESKVALPVAALSCRPIRRPSGANRTRGGADGHRSRFEPVAAQPRAARQPRRTLPLDPPGHLRAGGAAVGRGLRDPVDARRQPGEVASRAHHLVFRDLRARAAAARLPRVRCRLSLPVQFLLQRHRRAPPAPRARPALAPRAGGDPRLSPPRRRGDARTARRGARAARNRRPDRTRAAARAAAPGTHPHRCEAPALAQPAETRVPEAMAAHADAGARAQLDRLRGGPARDRARRRRFLLRQRDAAPPRLARRVPRSPRTR